MTATLDTTRRELLGRSAAAAALAAGGAAGLACGSEAEPRTPRAVDAIERRTLSELRSFTRWLRRHDQRGFVGEVGWPAADPRWQALARRWYSAADEARLWVTNWATGEWWADDYPLASYRPAIAKGSIGRPDRQAAVIEAHRGAGRGVNVAGGAFGAPSIDATSPFSAAAPGVIETAYHFDGPATYGYLRTRGIGLVRIECRWERLQPRLGEALDLVELTRVRAALDAARDAGLAAVLDVHNYGAYYLAEGGQGVRRALGSPQLPVEALGDLWARLVEALGPGRRRVAWGLMNEPVRMPGEAATWERASQLAVDAIRARGDRHLVVVGGYEWSGIQVFARRHPRPWIRDGAVRYEAHHYFDLDHSSRYELSYDAQLARLSA